MERKSLEPISLHLLGEKSVRSMQRLFNRAPLKDEQLLHTYQKLLASRLSSKNGMLSVDNSNFVKKGIHSISVKRQYCGCLDKTESCQVGVFMAYAGTSGYGLVGRELYIPKEWYELSHESLRKECHLPLNKLFLTKTRLHREC